MNIFRVHPIIHVYNESSTPFGTNMQYFHLQRSARELHWTRGETLNPGKRRWATAWTWMKPEMTFLVLNQPPIFYSNSTFLLGLSITNTKFCTQEPHKDMVTSKHTNKMISSCIFMFPGNSSDLPNCSQWLR